MQAKILFLQKFDMGIKNTKFDAEFESVEKSAKQITPEKLSAENLCTHY